MIRRGLSAVNQLNPRINLLFENKHQLTRNAIWSFSAIKYHPTIEKISKCTNEAELTEKLPELVGLTQKNREFALKIILKKIYSCLVTANVLNNTSLVNQLKKHPEIYVQALLYRIKEQMKQLNEHIHDKQKCKPILSNINDSFVLCFDYLKKIQDHSTKQEVMLHKRFADYYLLYLSKLVDPSQRKEILVKSKDFYRSSLGKMSMLIKQEQQKMNFTKEAELQMNEKEQQRDLRVNSMKQNIRMLIQTNSESVIHLFMVQNQLSQYNSKNNQEKFQEDIIGLLNDFQRALGYYQIYEKMKVFSIFYHRLRKIAHEINYYAKLTAFRKRSENNQYKAFEVKCWKQLVAEMENLYEQSCVDMQEIIKEPKHLGNVQQICLLLLSIRIHAMVRQEYDEQMFKQRLFSEVKAILEMISIPEQKKVVSSRLARVVKHMLNSKAEKQRLVPSKKIRQ